VFDSNSICFSSSSSSSWMFRLSSNSDISMVLGFTAFSPVIMSSTFFLIVSSHCTEGIFSIYSYSNLTTNFSKCFCFETVFRKNPSAIDFMLQPDRSISMFFKLFERSCNDNPNLFSAESWIVFFERSIYIFTKYLLQFSKRSVRPLKLKKSAFWSEIEIFASFRNLCSFIPYKIISNPFSVKKFPEISNTSSSIVEFALKCFQKASIPSFFILFPEKLRSSFLRLVFLLKPVVEPRNWTKCSSLSWFLARLSLILWRHLQESIRMKSPLIPCPAI